MTKRCGIYAISNRVSRDSYVGQSVDIDERWRKHIRALKSGNHPATKLQKAWNEYGEENFDFLVLKECEKDELDYYEVYYTKNRAQYNKAPLGMSVDISDLFSGEELADFRENVETLNRIWDSLSEEEKAAHEARWDAEEKFFEDIQEMDYEELKTIDRSKLTEEMIEFLDDEIESWEVLEE